MAFNDECAEIQKELKASAAKVIAILRRGVSTIEPKVVQSTIDLRPLIVAADTIEIAANAILAYRHLEDAAMRVGKMIQAWDGGTSVYDK